ncbi:hypothetical protein Tco_0878887 [Tanacetum coccineum]|uniref:Uncharacterized protein n=1 Tax=Tanacetum coccineum TaxID=301880 RepID=A0ABQ5BZ64_9ASTR
MFLNVDQLEKQLDKEEFQKIGYVAAFKVLETQFQTFIKPWIYLDDEYVIMTRKYFLEYTQLKILEFRDTMIQHMESVKMSIDKRVLYKREYNSRVNKRQMQTTEEKVDTSKALDASLVNTESSGTESGKQDTSITSGNDVDVDDAYIKPVYDEEPMAEVQLSAEFNVSATGQQHTEQPEFNNEGEVDQNVEQCHDKRPLPAKLTNNQITDLSYQSLESENICLKKTVAQFQKDFLRMEAHCVNLELKYKNQALKEWYSSNNMVHNNYLEEAKKKTQEKGTSINVQEEQNLDLSVGTPFNLKKERIKTWTKYNVISGSPSKGIDDSIGKIVTNRFTHIMLSALRRSDIENKLAWLVLTELEDSYKDGDGDASFQQSQIHYHMLMLKLQRHTISIKIQESRNLKI